MLAQLYSLIHLGGAVPCRGAAIEVVLVLRGQALLFGLQLATSDRNAEWKLAISSSKSVRESLHKCSGSGINR
jgi:hypothetical protein